jgi:hypothetical protein
VSIEEEGLIAAKAISQWRVETGAAMPNPLEGEVVMLKSHIDRRLSLLPSNFLMGLLNFYQLQLHQIPPNILTIIAGFTAVCKGYMGI